MKFEDILVEKRGRIVCVTLNRPERMNAISVQTSAELLQVLQEYRDDPEQWVMIFTGAGSKSFCSGMYVTEAAHKTQEKGKTEGYTIFKPWTDMMQSIRKPGSPALLSSPAWRYCSAEAGIWWPTAISSSPQKTPSSWTPMSISGSSTGWRPRVSPGRCRSASSCGWSSRDGISE